MLHAITKPFVRGDISRFQRVIKILIIFIFFCRPNLIKISPDQNKYLEIKILESTSTADFLRLYKCTKTVVTNCGL